MASLDDTQEAVLAAIEELAKLVGDDPGNWTSSRALEFSQAANELAEAYAWLRVPGQPH